MSLIVGKHDVEIRYGKVPIGFGTSHPRKQVADDVETRKMLVIGADDEPGRQWGGCSCQHQVARIGVSIPVLLSDPIDRTCFPLLEWVAASIAKPPLLLLFPTSR